VRHTEPVGLFSQLSDYYGPKSTIAASLLLSSLSKRLLFLTGIACLETILVLTMASPGQAAEPPTKETLAELQFLKEETVSIAARHEQPISEAPSNVYVITDEDIRQSGATDIPTLLRRIPGIEVMMTTGAEYNVSARGDNQLMSNKMLVMVDGRSIYIDVEGLVFWKAIPVTLAEIKQIEVLKGPASALYGFNAFDGVVNIITKSPEEMKGTTLQFGGGEFGTITSAAVQAGTVGKFGYRLSLGHDQNQQWRNRDALAFRSHKFNVQTEYNLSDESKLQVSGGLVDANRFDGPITNLEILSTQFTQGYADAVYRHRNFLLRSWWSKSTIEPEFITHPSLARFLRETGADGSSTVSFLGTSYNVEAQDTVEFGSTNRLTYGVNYRYNRLSGSATSQVDSEDRLGIYIQDEWKVLPALSAVAGIRYDLHTQVTGTFSPRLAVLYQILPEHTLRLAASVAYRPPTLFERNLDLRIFTGSPTPLPLHGSTTLSPEQIISYEVGYQGWFFKHRLRARLDLFYNHLSDLISFRTIGTTRTFVNGLDADVYGGEAGVELLLTRWLSGFANFSYERITQRLTSVDRRGAPDVKFNIGLRAEWENGLSGEAVLHHVDSTTYPLIELFGTFRPFGAIMPDPTVPSYNLLNLRAGYRFWKEKAEVAVSVFNALNDRHKEHPLGDTIGSRVMGWVTIKF
jgi:iron complex outermembrane receptor protein